MAKKEFQAESKKLMDMMINSIYTNKEIFLRELISNASDAIDKLYYKSLTDPSVGMNKGDFRILLTRDKDSRTLTISDNGIGMTKEELEKNLGTIARSGSLDFKTENQSDNIDIIGQFGVGFYSAFMVAKKVTVISRAQGAAGPPLPLVVVKAAPVGSGKSTHCQLHILAPGGPQPDHAPDFAGFGGRYTPVDLVHGSFGGCQVAVDEPGDGVKTQGCTGRRGRIGAGCGFLLFLCQRRGQTSGQVTGG